MTKGNGPLAISKDLTIQGLCACLPTVLWDKMSVLGEDTLYLKLRYPESIWTRWGRSEIRVIQTEWAMFTKVEKGHACYGQRLLIRERQPLGE